MGSRDITVREGCDQRSIAYDARTVARHFHQARSFTLMDIGRPTWRKITPADDIFDQHPNIKVSVHYTDIPVSFVSALA